jgi:ubiquinone/menaquinone biosynthesis C-methylase UbiE
MTEDGKERAMQRQHFLDQEGDRWFDRNRDGLRSAAADPVLAVLSELPPPRRLLEIGCADGWRLDRVAAAWGTECSGVDPSAVAISEGRKNYPALSLSQGTADSLPFADDGFDVVVFGFCLYLCDPAEHFRIAAEADRVLEDRGWMLIYDFLPPTSFRNPYLHRPGLYSYKMDYARMFDWHPAYALHSVRRAEPNGQPAGPDDRIAVTVLRKSMRDAFPDNPYLER